MVVKWQFYDGSTTEVFEVNPNEGGSPTRRKTMTYKNTAAPDGKTLVFEGRDEPGEISFSGTLLTQEQFDMFEEWWDKRQQVRITDDLGRQYWVYIHTFDAKRIRARSHPWKHEYTVEATILDWPA